MKQFKGFIFDIDGTILPGDSTLGKNMLLCLQNIINKGYILAFATGRNFKFASEVAEQLSGKFYLAINNGAVIIQYPEKKILEDHFIHIDEVEEVREYLATGGHPAIVNGTIQNGEKTYIFHNPPMKEPIINFVNNMKKTYHQIKNLHESDESHLACMYATLPTNSAHNYYENIQSKFNNFNFKLIADPICIGFHWLGLMPDNTGKENVIHYLATKYNIEKKQILVAGDDYNDLEMIKQGGYSLAMGTAPEDVKEHAHQVIGSAKEDALLNFILENVEL